MTDELLRQIHATLCRLQATMRMYWPDDADAGTTILAGETARLGPFTSGQVVGLFTDKPVKVFSSPSEALGTGLNAGSVPAGMPIYQLGVHVYVIRTGGPARYLYIEAQTEQAVVGIIRGDTDIR